MQKKPRTKTPVAFKLSSDLLQQLEEFRRTMDVPASKTGIIEAALREFLERRRHRREARA